MNIFIYVDVGFDRFARELIGMMKNKRTCENLKRILAPLIQEMVGSVAFKFIGVISLNSARKPWKEVYFNFQYCFSYETFFRVCLPSPRSIPNGVLSMEHQGSED